MSINTPFVASSVDYSLIEGVTPREDLLIWIDLETTGLDVANGMQGVRQHKILELGLHLTDSQFNIIDDGLELVIHHDLNDLLPLMNDYVKDMHTANGLFDRVFASTTTLHDAEIQVMNYLAKFGYVAGSSPLCGNNVGFDGGFIAAQMPNLSKIFHYRKIDVSTIKEVVKRLNPDLAAQVQKAAKHRGLADIKESVAEFKLYQQNFFK